MAKRKADYGNRSALLVMFIGLLVLLTGGTSLAAAPAPHGSFAANPDACAACHRVHTATAKNLIKDPNGGAMCNTCHAGGLGADTDATNGVYLNSGEPDHTWGSDNGVLLGGGFAKVGGTTSSTSKHRLDEALAPPGSTTGATITLKCLDCHSPHYERTRPNQYRLLRLRPNGAASDLYVDWNGPWDGPAG